MNQPLPPKIRRYYPLIPDVSATRVLMVRRGDAWEPPCWETTERDLFAGGALVGWVKQQLGLDVSQLRVAQVQLDAADQRWDWALIAMENNGGSAHPGTRWVDRTTLADLRLHRPELREGIDSWLRELASAEQPAARPVWSRPGWWSAINAWVTAALAAQGRALIAPLEQRKVWGISALLRGQTVDGAIYIKASPTLPLFANEAAITGALATLFPRHIPTPLALDSARRLLLLNDFGGQLLYDAPREAWHNTVDVYAELQLATVGRIDELLAAGCLDRRLPQLAVAIPALADSVPRYSSLSAAELHEFALLLPRLASACSELAEAAVPATLAHGDLHDHNIAIVDGQPIFFDWSDACIAHPFFDLPTLAFSEFVDRDPAAWATIRDRYLRHWTAYAPLEELKRIAGLASLLGSVHQVLSYVTIVSNLEPVARWELSGGLDDFARQLLTEARSW